MSGFTSLATAVSGLRAAQTGLAVTGHNMANSEIPGYSRQRVVQKESYYQRIGQTAYGALTKGLGTDTLPIQQIRNQFLDLTYRTRSGKLNFYAVKSTVGAEIENLLGEMQGSYNFQSVINDMWGALQELSKHPEGVETRDYFIATCLSFATKSNEVYNSLFDYQHNLDGQIRSAVSDINSLVSRINELNTEIRAAEASGDHANDYRDERNLCLDRLSELIPIEYSEDNKGNFTIFSDGHQLLSQGAQNYMGLKYISGSYTFVEPVFTSSTEILSADTPPSKFEAYLNFNKPMNAKYDNDYGKLKALVLSRGAMPAYYNGLDSVWKPLPPERVLKEPNPANYAAGASDAAYLTDKANYDNDLYQMQRMYPGYQPDGTYVPTADDQDVYAAALYNYKFCAWSVENCLIPKTQMQLDAIVHSVITMVNDALAPALGGKKDPNAPYDLQGNRSCIEVFVRNNMPRWDADGNLIPETTGNYYSQYSIGNISVNPLLLDSEGGFNLLAFSPSGDRDDPTLINDLLIKWKDNTGPYAINIGGVPYGIQDAYQKFIMQLGVEIEEANNFVDNQSLQVVQADNMRNSVMGVSMDEEMNNMMKYQYAYQAAARILNVIDSMIDKIVNSTGRSGL